MTPREWAGKTVKDLEVKRKLKSEGERQAKSYSFENIEKVKKRCNSR